MKTKYYVTSIGYNVLGDELDQELCEYNGELRFAQPSFERAWSTVEFDSELEALNKLQEMHPDRKLTMFEDTGKILTTFGHETGFTSMVIRQTKRMV